MDPVRPINGKKLILMCGLGAVVFTIVMGFGTYFLAKVISPFLQKPSAHASSSPSNSSNR